MRNSQIQLYSGVNLTIGDNNTFYFESVEKQRQYFSRRNILTIDAVPYIRNNRTFIRVPFTMAQVYKVNYCSYINKDYENKLTYCFVVARAYINDSVTELEIVEDIQQTWLFDYSVQPCFVERMHTASDRIGDNLTTDSFDLGDYKITTFKDGLGSVEDVMCIVAECSFDAYNWTATGETWGDKETPILYNRNGMYSATELVAFPVRIKNTDGTYKYASNHSAFLHFMQHVNNGDSGVTVNDILSMWLYPFSFLQPYRTKILDTDTSEDLLFRSIYEIGGVLQGVPVTVGNRPNNLDGYIPKNNKLLTFPYCQLMAFNNNGSATTYRYEYFENPDNIEVAIFGTTTSEAKTRICPHKYKGFGINHDFAEALDSAPYPLVSYLGDAYNIWSAQNRNTIQNQWDALELSAVTGIVGGAFGSVGQIGVASGGITGSFYNSQTGATTLSMGNQIGTGALVGMGASAVSGMVQSGVNSMLQAKALLAQHQDARLAPNTAKGVQSQGIAYQSGKTFTFYNKTIDAQHAKRIDDYFTMYGYPINEIKAISRKNRNGFTFIKTVDCHITSLTMPEDQRRVIEESFNNGVRFWSNVDNIGNYTINNEPIA